MAFQGHLDTVERDKITGWAWDDEAPDATVSLVVTANDQVIARVAANLYRSDLEAAGIGNGRHGFTTTFAKHLSILDRYEVAVAREPDGAMLEPSPRILEPADSFTSGVRETIRQILLATNGPTDDLERLRFVDATGQILRQRWIDRGDLRAAKPGTKRPRALVIDDQRPAAGRDAGSNAITSHMQSLRRLGFDVDFAAADGTTDDGLAAEGIECLGQPFYASIEELLRSRSAVYKLVYLHRIACASAYLGLVRQYQPRARIVFSVADLHGLRLARQAEVEQRHDLKAYAEHVRFKELITALQADAVITHSSAEASILAGQVPRDKIHVVPWALTTRPTDVPFASRHDLAFIGGYRHIPNVDAAMWLAEEIMPRVGALAPSIRCLLVGSHMPKVLRDLRSGTVVPVGFVEDLAEVFDRVRLTVAPLAFGAGVKGKVLDSLAYGIPCVCTSSAAEGIALPGPLADLVCDDPDALARTIVRLHDDEALNAACCEAGIAYVETSHREADVDRLLAAACGVRL